VNDSALMTPRRNGSSLISHLPDQAINRDEHCHSCCCEAPQIQLFVRKQDKIHEDQSVRDGKSEKTKSAPKQESGQGSAGFPSACLDRTPSTLKLIWSPTRNLCQDRLSKVQQSADGGAQVSVGRPPISRPCDPREKPDG
jgi:hypothetical protein